jgi:RHS repeat-associated protein
VIVEGKILAQYKTVYPSTLSIVYFYLDNLGSRRVVLSSGGSAIDRYRYSAWGKATQDVGSDDLRSYTGKDYDASGLIYFNARYYDAVTGRFLTEDPSRKGGNWYAYCDSDPVNRTDPTGKLSIDYVADVAETHAFRLFAATIYGEAGGSSAAAQKAVGFVIENRVGQREWKALDTTSKVIEKSGFDAFSHNTKQFQEAMSYLSAGKTGSGQNRPLDALVKNVLPVYTGNEPDTTGGSTLYYSPAAQAELSARYPASYSATPNWDFGKLQETTGVVSGLKNTDDFKFYRYK